MAAPVYVSGVRYSGGSASTHTQSVTLSGSNLFLTVGTFVPSGKTVTGVTANGVAMTAAVDFVCTNHASGHLYKWVLGNAAEGTYNVVATLSAANALDMSINWFSGAQSSSTVDSSNTGTSASSANFTWSTTTVADNCCVIGQTKDDRGDAVQGTNTTGRAGYGTGAGDVSWSTSTDQTPAGSKSLNITWGGATPVDAVIISIAPYSAPSATEKFFYLF